MWTDALAGPPITVGLVIVCFTVTAAVLGALFSAAKKVKNATRDATAPIQSAIAGLTADIKEQLRTLAADIAATGRRVNELELRLSDKYLSREQLQENLTLRFDVIEEKIGSLDDMITQKRRPPARIIRGKTKSGKAQQG